MGSRYYIFSSPTLLSILESHRVQYLVHLYSLNPFTILLYLLSPPFQRRSGHAFLIYQLGWLLSPGPQISTESSADSAKFGHHLQSSSHYTLTSFKKLWNMGLQNETKQDQSYNIPQIQKLSFFLCHNTMHH